jgi:hypothetical protein
LRLFASRCSTISSCSAVPTKNKNYNKKSY